MQKSTDGKLPNKRKFGIIPYLREKIRTQRECRIPQKKKKREKVTFGIQGGYYEFYRKRTTERNDSGKRKNAVPQNTGTCHT